jgi:hypothetical protein
LRQSAVVNDIKRFDPDWLIWTFHKTVCDIVCLAEVPDNFM